MCVCCGKGSTTSTLADGQNYHMCADCKCEHDKAIKSMTPPPTTEVDRGEAAK